MRDDARAYLFTTQLYHRSLSQLYSSAGILPSCANYSRHSLSLIHFSRVPTVSTRTYLISLPTFALRSCLMMTWRVQFESLSLELTLLFIRTCRIGI